VENFTGVIMKKILIAILSLAVVLLLVAAVLPKDFKIESSVVINKPVNQVFAYLKFMENGKKWQPWEKLDPNASGELKGVDGRVGAVASWSGNSKVGVGEQEIKNIVKNERIDFELRFQKPMKTTNQAYFITESVDKNSTKVIWGMTGRTPYPFNLVCFYMRDKVTKQFADGLVDLKNVLEKK
jgi:uncharacterized protein YndB with AHSA1/START domain